MSQMTRISILVALISTTIVFSMATTPQKPLVEFRSDAFGGTGLFAVDSIDAGVPILKTATDDVIFGVDASSLIDREVVDQLSSTKDTLAQRGAWSIAAALATFRLLPNSISLGVPMSVARNAAALPWTDCQWQLPLLWPEEILDQALINGFEEAVDDGEAKREEESEIFSVLLEAKKRVQNLRQLGDRLAQKLGPVVQENGSNASEEEILLACRQGMALVMSRTCQDSSGRLALLPTLDCANHAGEPNCGFSDTGSGVALVSTRSIAAGEQCYISYGILHLSAAFAGYGFIPDHLVVDPAARALQCAAICGQKLARKLLEE